MKQTNELNKKLLSTILDNSLSKTREESLLEWEFDHFYEGDENCPCGKHIRNIYVIKNKHNSIMLTIGSSCIKDFFGTHESILKELQYKYNLEYTIPLKLVSTEPFKVRLRTESYKFFLDQRVITQWEFDFIENVRNFKYISNKQKEIIGKINTRIKSNFRRIILN